MKAVNILIQQIPIWIPDLQSGILLQEVYQQRIPQLGQILVAEHHLEVEMHLEKGNPLDLLLLSVG
jgi:hypothetical protein